MRFVTVQDVLNGASTVTPIDSVVLGLDASVQDALAVMHENDVSHLPVAENGTIMGVVTHQSVCYLLKTMQEITPEQRSVKNVLEEPVIVRPDEDVYDCLNGSLSTTTS